MLHSSTPRRGELLMTALFAVFLRLAVFGGASIGGHLSINQITAKGDTISYMAVAATISGERSYKSLSDYESRVFPGYPVMIAMLHRLGIPLPFSALCITWISAGIAAATAGKIFGDARIAWAMTCLIPHYLINSSMGMSEAPLLAMICLGLLASQSDRLILAGIIFGFAGIIRPVACFALAGLVLALLREGRWKSTIMVLSSAIGMFAIEVLLMQIWSGDALRGVRVYAHHPDAYAGHLLGWPFQSLITTPMREATSPFRIAYTWAHVLVLIMACGMICDRALRAGKSRPRDAVSFLWLVGNTLFVLCIGGVWGFRHFPRFIIPASPALFWTLRNFLPRRPRWWLILATLLGIHAVVGVIHSS